MKWICRIAAPDGAHYVTTVDAAIGRDAVRKALARVAEDEVLQPPQVEVSQVWTIVDGVTRLVEAHGVDVNSGIC